MTKDHKTLLQKIMERRVRPRGDHSLSQTMLEASEVCVAWAEGKIDTDEARLALGHKSNGQVAQSTGTAIKNLCHGRYITITWNPKTAEEDGMEEGQCSPN